MSDHPTVHHRDMKPADAWCYFSGVIELQKERDQLKRQVRHAQESAERKNGIIRELKGDGNRAPCPHAARANTAEAERDHLREEVATLNEGRPIPGAIHRRDQAIDALQVESEGLKVQNKALRKRLIKHQEPKS